MTTTDSDLRRIRIGIAGNPNSGKTSIFNRLTGSHQHVGNWPGVTVEQKSGQRLHGGWLLEFIDLPGTYSLAARSVEEVVARSFLLNEEPDLVLNVVDASSLERNLLLTTQLLELGVKLVVALNMVDVARENGVEIRRRPLAQLLGAPVVETVARRGEGIERLLDTLVAAHESRLPGQRHIHIPYGPELEMAIERLAAFLMEEERIRPFIYECGDAWESGESRRSRFPLRWFCTRLLSGDERVTAFVEVHACQRQRLEQLIDECGRQVEARYGVGCDIHLADRLYSFIKGLMKETSDLSRQADVTLTDRIDDLLVSRLLGLPIFLAIVWGMFDLTYRGGSLLTPAVEAMFGALADGARGMLSPGFLRDLIVNGIIDGVGSVMAFLPSIAILFLCIAFLEDSGYMSRAAFLMDRFMHAAGLHGKSFIALFTGFGCNAPAVLACRTLENPSDRLITMLIAPLMSCTARFPVYILFAGTFFPDHAGSVVFLIYLTGILLAVLMANLFRRTLFRDESAPFVLELPPYRLPQPAALLRETAMKCWIFVQKAGTVILLGVALVWVLTAFPRQIELKHDYPARLQEIERRSAGELQVLQERYQQARVTAEAAWSHPLIPFSRSGELQEMEKFLQREREGIEARRRDEVRQLRRQRSEEIQSNRYAGRIGRLLEPLLAPLGFDWRVGFSLIPGFVAKEVVVGSFAVLYLGEQEENGDETHAGLADALKESGDFTPLVALSFMLFSLLYTPCTATVAVIRKESGSMGWALFSIAYSLVLAWSVSFVVYQGGRLLGFQ